MFVINGKADCKDFAHAICVANYLSEKLPNFVYVVHSKLGAGWNNYLIKLNKENTWYFSTSPVIWKELIPGGKKYLIGGLSEFWEYCYDYYGLESFLSKQNLEELVKMNINLYQRKRDAYVNRKGRVVTIIGAQCKMMWFLVEELINIKSLYLNNDLLIRLYVENMNKRKSIIKEFEEMINYFNRMFIFGRKRIIKPVYSLTEALYDCDLLLLLEDYDPGFERKISENRDEWFETTNLKAKALADAVNEIGKYHLRIMVCNISCPNCFFASSLLKNCKRIKNIVVPTSYKGLPMLDWLSRKHGLPISEMSAPPVWGFTDKSTFIDSRSIIYKAKVLIPFKRALNDIPGSTLPASRIKTDLRYMSHLITSHKEDKEKLDKEMKANRDFLRREPFWSRLKSIVEVIKIWYNKDQDAIISLGICSNGSFGLPNGVVFSQPASLNNKMCWKPCLEYPVSEHSFRKIKQLLPDVLGWMKKYELDKRCEETFVKIK